MRGCAEAGPRLVFSEVLGILGYTNTVFVRFHRLRAVSLFLSHARGHLRVSRFARRTTEKRETARSLMFSYIQCVHPIQDYMIHSVEIITDLIVFVCLFWQIGREGLILMEEFTTLITSIGPPPGSGLGEVSSSLPPAPPRIKRRYYLTKKEKKRKEKGRCH